VTAKTADRREEARAGTTRKAANGVRFPIPEPLRIEHQALHAVLSKAAKEAGEVGACAREVARLLHPHFVREEEFALPPLALLEPLARGAVSEDMRDALPLVLRLKTELPAMLAEHRRIVAALEKLRSAAAAARIEEYERFADALVLHARTEEQVLYPAAVVAGEYLALRLGPGGAAPVK
jgi:hemerythrin HHE cation binding domain-containing protein